MLVLAVVVLASHHQVKKTRNAHVHPLVVRKTTPLRRKLAFTHRIEHARLLTQIVRVSAFVSKRAKIFEIEFFADVFGGFWLDNLALDRVREEAVEAILAVTHVEVDAWIEASVHMVLAAFLRVVTFIHCEILVRTEILHRLQLGL